MYINRVITVIVYLLKNSLRNFLALGKTGPVKAKAFPEDCQGPSLKQVG